MTLVLGDWLSQGAKLRHPLGTDMNYDVDEMTAAERPRKRILVSAVAVLLPVVALVGAAAWFVRSYVLPPTVSFESKAIASAVATPAPAESRNDRNITGTARRSHFARAGRSLFIQFGRSLGFGADPGPAALDATAGAASRRQP